jgi:5-methyltetrahydrofolate--homocysteine methyltransferase
MDQEGFFKEIRSALMEGRSETVKELVDSCLEEGLAPQTILDQGLVAAMAVVGERFRNNEMFMPEVMVAARAMHAGLNVLDPVLTASKARPKGKVLLGTVKGDLHDIGKNMVNMMFRGAGYRLIDLGVDVPSETFLEAIREHQPDVVGLSALLTTTLPQMEATVEAIGAAGLRDKVVLMVGGAPVSESYAEKIGADGWAPDAVGAVQQAGRLVAARKQD